MAEGPRFFRCIQNHFVIRSQTHFRESFFLVSSEVALNCTLYFVKFLCGMLVMEPVKVDQLSAFMLYFVCLFACVFVCVEEA